MSVYESLRDLHENPEVKREEGGKRLLSPNWQES